MKDIQALQQRIDKLEATVNEMKQKFDDIVVVYIRLKDQLTRHLASLLEQSDTSGIVAEMNELARLLGVIGDKMLLPTPQVHEHAADQVVTLSKLREELQIANVSILEATSNSKQKSQNKNIEESEVLNLHKMAGSLENLLSVTSSKLGDREKLHASLRDIHKEFESREAELLTFIHTSNSNIQSIDTKTSSLVDNISWLECLEKLLQGDKLTDLKLLKMTEEKFNASSVELDHLNDSDQQFELTDRYNFIATAFNKLCQNSNEKYKQLKRIHDALESFESARKEAETYLDQAEKQLNELLDTDISTKNLSKVVEIGAKLTTEIDQKSKLFSTVDPSTIEDLDPIEIDHLNLVATDLTSRYTALAEKGSDFMKKVVSLQEEYQELESAVSKINSELGFFERTVSTAVRPTEANQQVVRERYERIKSAIDDFEQNTQKSVAVVQKLVNSAFQDMKDDILDQHATALNQATIDLTNVERKLQKLIEFNQLYTTILRDLRASDNDLEQTKTDVDCFKNLGDDVVSLQFSETDQIDEKIAEIDNLLRQKMSAEAERLRKNIEQLELKDKYDALYDEIAQKIELIPVPSLANVRLVSDTIEATDEALEKAKQVDFDQMETLKSKITEIEVDDYKQLSKLLGTKRHDLKVNRQNFVEIEKKNNQWLEGRNNALQNIESLSPATLIKTSTGMVKCDQLINFVFLPCGD